MAIFVCWSYIKDGKREYFYRPTYARSDEEALNETKIEVLMSEHPTYEQHIILYEDLPAKEKRLYRRAL